MESAGPTYCSILGALCSCGMTRGARLQKYCTTDVTDSWQHSTDAKLKFYTRKKIANHNIVRLTLLVTRVLKNPRHSMKWRHNCQITANGELSCFDLIEREISEKSTSRRRVAKIDQLLRPALHEQNNAQRKFYSANKNTEILISSEIQKTSNLQGFRHWKISSIVDLHFFPPILICVGVLY